MDYQPSLFGPRLRATRPLLRHARCPGVLARVRRCLGRFPELDEQLITVGVTRAADGIAVFEDMTIRFDIRRRLPTHYTVAHECTHLLQALRLVPYGEVQCDVWTLARDPLFHDEPPCYLPLPGALSDRWPEVSDAVGQLCRQAIERRPRHRTYLRWLAAALRDFSESTVSS